jgi:hypothetical protein
MNYFANILKCERKGRAAMKMFYKIVLIAVLLAFSGMACFSQTVTTPSDTVMTVQKQKESQGDAQSQTQNQYRNRGEVKGQGTGQNAGGAKAAKKVNSARPDMSKSKGARPNIVRPSGSGIPKGAGKPGGAGRFGGR